MPVGVLLTSWAMKAEQPNMRVLANVSIIVLGVIIASYGEIAFVLIGVIFQAGGILFESIRLVMVQKLLSGSEYKMDPLVSLYYFAPVCAAMNGLCCLIFEGPRLSFQAILDAGLIMLFTNAAVAFCLNVAVVFLVLSPFCIVLTGGADWQNFLVSFDAFGYSEGYPSRLPFCPDLVHPHHRAPNVRLYHCPRGTHLLQDRQRTSPCSIQKTH